MFVVLVCKSCRTNKKTSQLFLLLMCTRNVFNKKQNKTKQNKTKKTTEGEEKGKRKRRELEEEEKESILARDFDSGKKRHDA